MTDAWESEGGASEPDDENLSIDLPDADAPGESIKKWFAARFGWDTDRMADATPPPPENIASLRRQEFAATYLASLEAAHVDALASWRLDRLAPNQHGQRLTQFIQSLTGRPRVLNLVLGGRVGAGKSSAAVAAGWAAVDAGIMCRFVRHGAYLAMLRPDGAPADQRDWQIRKRFRDPGLLILDDLGAELDAGEASRFVREETLSLIGDRINRGRATIFTTNESSASIADTLGQRTYSRISEHGAALKFEGDDKRGLIQW